MARSCVALPALLLLAALCHTASAVKVDSVYAAVESDPRFSILKSALDLTGLADRLKDPNFRGTVFAPTNKAFLALLSKLAIPLGTTVGRPKFIADLLNYHVTTAFIPSSSIPKFPKSASTTTRLKRPISAFATSKVVVVRGFFSNAKVLQADIRAPKAVVHAISAVLLPPGLEDFPNCNSVVDMAAAKNLTVFVDLLKSSGLAPIFTKKSFSGTVLAPTNPAFAALLKNLKTTLPALKKDKKLLKKVLTYHVIGPKRYSANKLRNGRTLKTLNKDLLTVIVDGKGFGFKGVGSTARIRGADFLTCRAVIHVIGTVLLPKL